MIAAFLDDQLAWVIYQGHVVKPGVPPRSVWRTRDGGLNWERSTPLDTTADAVRFYPITMQFVDAQSGWLLASLPVRSDEDNLTPTALFRTGDGGQNWERLDVTLSRSTEQRTGFDSFEQTGMAFADRQTGVITLDPRGDGVRRLEPIVLWTRDGGASWQEQGLPKPSWYAQVFGSPFDQCWTLSPRMFSRRSAALTVSCSQEGPILYRTEDGGETWQAYRWPDYASTPLRRERPFQFLNPKVGWALADTLYKTVDGGQSWVPLGVAEWDTAEFSFISKKAGWALAGRYGLELDVFTTLVRTTDGGKTWVDLEPGLIP